jgi:intein-encoded DNA endonuclease-like protein
MITKEEFERLKKLHQDGYSVSEISKILNIKYNTVNYRINNLQIAPRFDRPNVDYFENINCEEKVYWLGFIYADGCLFSNIHGYKLDIQLQIQDKHHLEKLASIFESKVYERSRFNNMLQKQTDFCSFVLYSKKAYCDLLNCGIEENKSYIENDQILTHIPIQFMNHFIRGFFDGDGHIGYQDKSNGQGQFGFTGNKSLLSKIQNILIEIIGVSETNIHERQQNCCILQYGGNNNLMKIYNYMYNNSTIWLERKRIKFEEILETKINPVISPDRTQSPYKGTMRVNSIDFPWCTNAFINNKNFYRGQLESELEAAYYYDMEQVRQRGEEAKQFMNFPSKYNDFEQWINEGN